MTHARFASRLAAALLCFAATGASAQTGAFDPRSGYGTDDLQVVTIPFSRFQPFSSGTFSSGCCIGVGGERWPTAGTEILAAEIDAGLVPNGATIEEIGFYVEDTDNLTNHNFRGNLCRAWVDLDGTNSDGDCPVAVTSAGAPGDTVLTATPGLAVRYADDVDGDMTTESVSYVLFARFGISGQQVFDGSIRFRMARVLFRRHVSPAPAVAAFADVPTGHPFFQFVEALAASGITAGCGTGVYCPDAPLTRGQMAVFLAKALGLHWPGN